MFCIGMTIGKNVILNHQVMIMLFILNIMKGITYITLGMMIMTLATFIGNVIPMSEFREFVNLMQTIHPELIGPVLQLCTEIDRCRTYGQMDQFVAVSNFLLQVYNNDGKQHAFVDFKEV